MSAGPTPSFPVLPPHPDGALWSPNVRQAHDILRDGYLHGEQALRQSDNDAHRLHLHSDKILNRMLPILEALEPEVMNNEYIKEAAERLAYLGVGLERAAHAIEGV